MNIWWVKFDSEMKNLYFLQPLHFLNMDVRQVDLLTQFCKICTKFMEFSWLWLFKIVNYINAKRHEKFCRCGIGRIDATPVFSQTVLIILIHPVVFPLIWFLSFRGPKNQRHSRTLCILMKFWHKCKLTWNKLQQTF